MRSEHGLTAADVESVDAYMHDYVKTTTGLAEPHTGLEGKFSIYHVFAVALADPELARLRARVHVYTDPTHNKDSARVVLTLRDGRTVERHVAHNLGTPDNPMTDQQLQDKFVALAAPVLGHARADELAQACWKLPELGDIRPLLDLTVSD